VFIGISSANRWRFKQAVSESHQLIEIVFISRSPISNHPNQTHILQLLKDARKGPATDARLGQQRCIPGTGAAPVFPVMKIDQRHHHMQFGLQLDARVGQQPLDHVALLVASIGGLGAHGTPPARA
jgi:hypothetical protein